MQGLRPAEARKVTRVQPEALRDVLAGTISAPRRLG